VYKLGYLTVISETGFPHSACLFEYGETIRWAGFKPRIPKLPAYWGYVDQSDRRIYIKKFAKFQVEDSAIITTLSTLEAKYTNLWYLVAIGTDCIDFTAEASQLCSLQIPSKLSIFPCNLVIDLAKLNDRLLVESYL
jgi:hypothetical protein